MLNSWRNGLRYWLVWTLLGAYLSVARITEQSQHDGLPWWVTCYTEMSAAYLLGVIFPLVKKYYQLSWFTHWPTPAQWLRHLAISPFITLLMCILMDMVRYPFYSQLPAAYGMSDYLWLSDHVTERLLLEWPRIGVLYFSMVIAIYYQQEQARRNQQQQQAMAVQSELSSIKLLQLKSQLQPHFLFNSLNMISEKIATDPALAEDLLQQLSDLLRYYLAQSETAQVKLSEEVAMLHSYLAIVQKRFPEQIHYDETIADGLQDQMVPAMVLQPLMENAVMHTIHRHRGEVSIRLQITRQQRLIHIDVINSLTKAAPGSGALGIGLKNIRNQLALLYGDEARLSFDICNNQARLEIVFPAEQQKV